MPSFAPTSLRRLETCHPDLQRLFKELIKHVDCTIIVGHRGEEEQEQAVLQGKSKLHWPKSKHNSTPSMAVDVSPWPVDWKDTKRFYDFAGIVRAQAAILGIKIRWGGDWDGDGDIKDQKFNDLVHFELI